MQQKKLICTGRLTMSVCSAEELIRKFQVISSKGRCCSFFAHQTVYWIIHSQTYTKGSKGPSQKYLEANEEKYFSLLP